MKTNKLLMYLCLAVILVFFSGCTSLIKSTVITFHTLDNYSKDKTFSIAPISNQTISIEYKTYSKMIIEKLANYGYVYEATNENANIIINFDYQIDKGTSITRSTPVYGQTGVSQSYTPGVKSGVTAGLVPSPTYGVTGSQINTDIQYTRIFTIIFFDNDSLKLDKPESILEGKVTSIGSSNSLAEIIPILIEAYFQKFPRMNGSTSIVVLTSK